MEYPNEMINDLFKAIFQSKRWMLLEFDWSYSTDVKQFEIEFWNKRQYSYGIIGNGRLALLETEINGRELPPHAFSYNQNLGLLEGVNDLRVYRNSFNRTVIQVRYHSLSVTSVQVLQDSSLEFSKRISSFHSGLFWILIISGLFFGGFFRGLLRMIYKVLHNLVIPWETSNVLDFRNSTFIWLEEYHISINRYYSDIRL